VHAVIKTHGSFNKPDDHAGGHHFPTLQAHFKE